MKMLLYQENPINKMKVKESEIPIDILYNREVNAMKLNEVNYNLHERPLIFSLWKDFDGKKGHHMTRFHIH